MKTWGNPRAMRGCNCNRKLQQFGFFFGGANDGSRDAGIIRDRLLAHILFFFLLTPGSTMQKRQGAGKGWVGPLSNCERWARPSAGKSGPLRAGGPFVTGSDVGQTAGVDRSRNWAPGPELRLRLGVVASGER